MKRTRTLEIMVLGLVVCLAEVSSAAPMGTAWTYQGRLIYDSNTAEGLYDFQFKLFDDPCTGTQQGSIFDINDVDVIDGYFTVELDLGSYVFNGDARWLEIGVKSEGSNDPFTMLSPRQKITPTPYAIYSKNSEGLVLPYASSASAGVAFSITNDTAGTAISGRATATSVVNSGLEGISDSTKGAGVSGDNNYYDTHGSLGSTIYGVYGIDYTSDNFGYVGSNMYGVYGEYGSNGNYGYLGSSTYGVYGYALTHGVHGRAVASDGVGVYGEHWASNGAEPGVYGLSNSTSSNAIGVLGEISSTSPGSYSTGVRGINRGTGPLGIGVWGSQDGSGWGVYGTSVDGRGVFGVASGSDGVAVEGSATNSGNVTNYGGYFVANGTSGVGVYGWGKGYDFYAAGPGTNYGSESSIRWKRVVQSIDDALGKVIKLRGVYFNWDEEHGGHHDVGMIAEEVGEVLPEIVEYEENGIDATGMDYGKLTPLLVEAVKELKGENDRLKERVEALEKTIQQFIGTSGVQL